MKGSDAEGRERETKGGSKEEKVIEGGEEEFCVIGILGSEVL